MDERDEYIDLLKRIDAGDINVSNNKSAYSVYTSKNFKNIEDALKFLNEHHIDTNDVVSLLKFGGNFSATIFKLIFFDRIKTERYLIVDEKWFRNSLKKGDRELFSTEDRTLAESKFEEYRSFPPKYDDEYRHAFVLKRRVEWVSGRKIITDINRFPKSYPKDVLIRSDPKTNIKSSKDVLIIDHPLLVKE